MQTRLMGVMNMDFNATGQQLIMYCAFVKYFERKMGLQ
jgi:hypothetical protein